MNITFDTERLREVMENFHILTRLRVVLYDNSFRKILAVPESNSDFCSFIKNSKVLGKRCKACDTEAIEQCRKTNSLYRYTCHAGLTEAVSPLKMNGINLGYIMLGQVIDSAEKKQKKEHIISYVKEHTGADISSLYDSIPSKHSDRIRAAVSIMEACASYLWVTELIRVDKDSIASVISNYIESNLTENLSVDTLCLNFGISRNRLYRISKEFYGMSIAAYIRKKRVNHAAHLLKEGMGVAEAAISSGFGDYNYFSRIFKNETGFLPSKYKNKGDSL